MTSVIKTVLDYVAPLPPEKEKDQDPEQVLRNVVTEIALSSLSNIALISLSTGLGCYFSISNEIRWDYMIKGIVGGFIYVTVSLFSSMLRHIAIFERDLLSRTMSFTFNCVDVFSRVCVFSPFNVFGCIIHEGSHAVSAYLLYKNCTVQVTATTFTTWQTTIIKTDGIAGLSKLGSYLGEHCSKMVFIAMGPLVQVATCQIVLIGALILKSSYPELSKNLFLYSLDTSLDCMSYAQSALDPAKASPHSDFVFLWKVGGIHPCVAIIGLVAMPLISTLGYLVFRRQS
jgi:hypothetical protein